CARADFYGTGGGGEDDW
nr:immunoglobulin heavy chain junction region [Macaca mulatta]